jgi:hypothetical protein
MVPKVPGKVQVQVAVYAPLNVVWQLVPVNFASVCSVPAVLVWTAAAAQMRMTISMALIGIEIVLFLLL